MFLTMTISLISHDQIILYRRNVAGCEKPSLTNAEKKIKVRLMIMYD